MVIEINLTVPLLVISPYSHLCHSSGLNDLSSETKYWAPVSPDNEKEIYRANDMCRQVKYRVPRIHVVSVNQHGNQVEDSNTITK
jgi:hypothetical protein